MALFGSNTPTIPGMGGDLREVSRNDVPASERPPTGRDWSDSEKDNYYRNLRKNDWNFWYKESLRLMYEKHKINERVGTTPSLRDSMFSQFKSGMTPEQCANSMHTETIDSIV